MTDFKGRFKRGSKRIGRLSERGVRGAGSKIKTEFKASRERSKEEKGIRREEFRRARLSQIRVEARSAGQRSARPSKPLTFGEGLFGGREPGAVLFGDEPRRQKSKKRSPKRVKKKRRGRTVTFRID